MFNIFSLLKRHSPEPEPMPSVVTPPPLRTSTLVVQSYKTDGVSPWIRTCLDSVKKWAKSSGFAYEFIDDSFFEFAPDWFRQRCADNLLPVTDIARLYLLKEKLNKGSFDRVVWIDADVAVFAPSLLTLEGVRGYALSGETWIAKNRNGTLSTKTAVNNSMVVMSNHQVILDFLIVAGEEVVRRYPPGDIDRLTVGTNLLTRLASSMPLRVLPGTGTFSPPVILDIVNGGGEALNHQARMCNAPIGAANLCGSLYGTDVIDGGVGESELTRAVDLLMETRGEVFNGLLQPMNPG